MLNLGSHAYVSRKTTAVQPNGFGPEIAIASHIRTAPVHRARSLCLVVMKSQLFERHQSVFLFFRSGQT